MIVFKNSKLSKKEEKKVKIILSNLLDSYLDFYTTKQNLRLFIKDNLEIVFKSLEKGDYIFYDTEENGLLFVFGYSDNFNRKYIKLLTKNINSVHILLLSLFINIKEDLYIKLNKRNPLIPLLLYYNFEFMGNRGREVLMVRRRKYVKYSSN